MIYVYVSMNVSAKPGCVDILTYPYRSLFNMVHFCVHFCFSYFHLSQSYNKFKHEQFHDRFKDLHDEKSHSIS